MLDKEEDDNTVYQSPGAIEMSVVLSVQPEEYHSIKYTITIEEPYSAREGDTREDKYLELKAWLDSKVLERSVEMAPLALDAIKAFKKNINKIRQAEDDGY